MESHIPTELSKSRQKFFFLGPFALISVFVMVFIMGLVKIYSPDLGFHLKSAEWMVHNKQFIYTDSFSYSSEGNKYYDLQWLFQLMTYWSSKAGGEEFLVILNALLITVSTLLIFLRFSSLVNIENRNIKLGFFAFACVWLFQPLLFEIRPHVFSWIFLNLILLFLESYKKGNKKILFVLPVIMLFWANTHSLAILGLVTIIIYNAGNYFETQILDKRLLLFSGSSLIAMLITPYFIEGFMYPFKQFGIISGNSLLKSYIGEFQSPFTAKEIGLLGSGYFSNPLLILHLSALASLFSIYRSFRQKQFTVAILLAAFLILLYLANKNYGYFLMASAPFIILQLLGWIEDRKRKSLAQKGEAVLKGKAGSKKIPAVISLLPITSRLFNRFSIATIILSILISATTITDGYSIFRHSPFRFGFGFDNDQLPVEATAFLNEKKINGKLLNHLDFGGYLMANFNGQVYIDGRLEVIGEAVFTKYYKSLTVRNGVKNLIDEHNPDIVIFPYIKASGWWDYFLRNKMQSGYKSVYFDGLSVIYLKSVKYPTVPEITEAGILKSFVPGTANRITETIKTSKPKGLIVLVNGLWSKQYFSVAHQNKATYCFTHGYDTAALSHSIIGIEAATTQTPNIFKNLFIYFEDKKMFSEAQLCEDKSK